MLIDSTHPPGAIDFGDVSSRLVSRRNALVDTLATLKALTDWGRADGQQALVTADGSLWRFVATSTLAGDDVLVAEPDDSPSEGRWLRAEGSALLQLPIDFNTADAAVLLTVPAGCVLTVEEASWRVDTSFTGGASSAIGASSSNHVGFTTKGDILGGAAGDVAATLVSGALAVPGTLGGKMDTLAHKHAPWLPGDTVRFDRITSAFTAGAGALQLAVHIEQNLGA